MAETLTEADSYPATIQMPTAGENVSAADLRDKAIQRLTDRTNYIENRLINGLAGGTYTPSSSLNITSLRCSTVPATGSAVANKTYVDGEIATLAADIATAQSDISDAQSDIVGLVAEGGEFSYTSTALAGTLVNVSAVTVARIRLVKHKNSYVGSVYLEVTNSGTGVKSIRYNLPLTNPTDTKDVVGSGAAVNPSIDFVPVMILGITSGAIELEWKDTETSGNTVVRGNFLYYVTP